MKLNGYVLIYKPMHHRTMSNGCVYEHIIVAEQSIGRKLKHGEEVHHIDENRSNNAPDNLIVFKTKADHIRFHATGNKKQLPDGSYMSPVRISICEKCLQEYEIRNIEQKYCSIKCVSYESAIKRRKVERPSKEIQSNDIETMSWVAIGNKYGVSDNAIRKWAKSYGLK